MTGALARAGQGLAGLVVGAAAGYACSRLLLESYEAHRSSLIFETRRVRNHAGHPASIDPIAYEEMHAVLPVH